VLTLSSLPENIGLFCKRALSKRLYSAKETYIFKEPSNHSQPTALVRDASSATRRLIVCSRGVVNERQ